MDERRPKFEFATTHWSIVNQAGLANDGPVEIKKRRAALEELCNHYWYPLYAYARRRVETREQAEDLIQSFFAKVLEKNIVSAADVERGRFRAFLISSLKNHMTNQWQKQNAQKRGGGKAIFSLDFEQGESKYSIEPSFGLTPEKQFDRSWAITLLNRVLERLESEHSATGQAQQFALLKPFLVGNPDTDYSNVALQANSTVAAMKMAVSRLRKKYREALRWEIAQTVSTEEQIDDEIRDLFEVIQ